MNKNLIKENNKKISIWQEIKQDISIIWKTKKKWIIVVYLLIATFGVTIAAFNRRKLPWKEWCDLSGILGLIIFPIISVIAAFALPFYWKKFQKYDKWMIEIIKKVKVNNPKKYRKISLISKINALFLILGSSLLIGIWFTIPERELAKQLLIGVVLLIFWSMSLFIAILTTLYCKEINDKGITELETK